LTVNAETLKQYRAKHPERAKLSAQINAARQVAAMRVAARHPGEWEAVTQRECKERGIPRYLPRIDPARDGRGRT
jgi:LDH2 family malate/lactate/ureidoglycolate dehydrogenase